VTIYVAGIGLWDRVNAAHAKVPGEPRPVRAVAPAGSLHHGLAVEIHATAASRRVAAGAGS
jgi:hypothetical protein